MRQAVTLLFVLLHCTCVRAQSDAPRRTENVILITMDGLRWQELFGGAVDSLIDSEQYTHDQDRMRADYFDDDPLVRRHLLMPFFWDTLAPRGQVYGDRDAGSRVDTRNRVWYSYPGYNEILTGAADDRRVTGNDKVPNPNVTVLEWLNQTDDYAGRVAAFTSWDVFNWIINEDRSGLPVNAGYDTAAGPDLSDRERYLNKLQEQAPRLWGGVRPDFLTHNYALAYLGRQHPRVAYIGYGETDDFAHDGSYNRYLDAAHATDAMWRDLWAFLQSDPFYRGKTSLVFVTDHGRGTTPLSEWQGHGHDGGVGGEIWLAVVGPDTPARGAVSEGGPLYQDQVAATVAALLGLDYRGADGQAGPPVPGITEARK